MSSHRQEQVSVSIEHLQCFLRILLYSKWSLNSLRTEAPPPARNTAQGSWAWESEVSTLWALRSPQLPSSHQEPFP